jgi:2-hydroxychromene-2-carboxylate isomerase
MPEVFPVNGLNAARLAIAAGEIGRTADFTRAVFAAQFAEGLNIADDGVLTDCLESCGLDAEALWARSKDEAVKAELRRNTEQAQVLGIFGAPSLTIEDGELFWGDDRLEQAVAWAVGNRNSSATAEV